MSLQKYIKDAGKWLRRLQRSSESRKRFWLILFSGISMAFVVVLWLSYVNLSLPGIPGMPAEEDRQTQEREEETTSFFEALKEGLRIIGNRVRGEAERAQRGARQIWQAREFAIEGGGGDLTRTRDNDNDSDIATSTLDS